MSPKLSICVPTYNRITELKTCLEFLLPQVSALSVGSVEVVIVNNASTDGTAEFIDTLLRHYPFVHVFHNSANLGFDGNTAKCIEYATGEYITLLSDDDRYCEGQVSAILETLSRRDYGLIILNYYSFIRDVDHPYKTNYGPEHDALFPQAREIINYYTIGHLSGFIYNSTLAKETLAELMAKDPIVRTDRSRGIYFELAIRLAYRTQLPAYYIGARRLAVRIPPQVDYDEIQNIGVDYCRFFTRLYTEGLISKTDLEFRYRATAAVLPQLIVRCTPYMSVTAITQVTHGLQTYLSEEPQFKKSLLLLRAARFTPTRWLYRVLYRAARFAKRTIKGAR